MKNFITPFKNLHFVITPIPLSIKPSHNVYITNDFLRKIAHTNVIKYFIFNAKNKNMLSYDEILSKLVIQKSLVNYQ